jgi:hypothetical protein
MNQSVTPESSTSDNNKSELILAVLDQLQQDVHLAKCEIKTAIREVSIHQDALDNSLGRLRVAFVDIDARLHGIEIVQQRQNSST